MRRAPRQGSGAAQLAHEQRGQAEKEYAWNDRQQQTGQAYDRASGDGHEQDRFDDQGAGVESSNTSSHEVLQNFLGVDSAAFVPIFKPLK